MKYANFMGTIRGIDDREREWEIEMDIVARSYEEALGCMDIIVFQHGIEDYEADFYQYIETITSNVSVPVPYIDN